MEQNSPPGVLITGSPGGGKSFFAFTMTCQMALQGVWVAYIDPKGDALPMANLKGIGEIQTFDLRNGNDGILDPFSLGADEADKILLALETIRLFSGRLSDDQVTVLGEAINEVVIQPDPSLNKVVDLLSASTESVARGLATNLGVMRRLPFARLCFSPQKTVDIDLRGGLTIVTLLGLDLPTSTTPQEDYSIPNRLAIGVMYLLTSLIRQLMMSQDNSHPKAVVIDEAWAVTATASGQKVVEELARMGRSLNVSLVLVSQNAGDFTSSGLVNSISSKFAFRTKTSAEATDVLKLLEVEDSVGNRDMLKGLNNGECLMQDNGGRVSRVQITSWNQDWRLAFDTNPTTKGKAQ